MTINESKTPKQYWLRSLCLSDDTVREVVADYNGKVLSVRNANYKIELTPECADEINMRFSWGLKSW